MTKSDFTIKIEELLQKELGSGEIIKHLMGETLLSKDNLRRRINKTKTRMIKNGELMPFLTAATSYKMSDELISKIEELIKAGSKPNDITNELHPLHKSECPEWGKFFNIVKSVRDRLESPVPSEKVEYQSMRERAKSQDAVTNNSAQTNQTYKIPNSDSSFNENRETGEAVLQTKTTSRIKTLEDLIRVCEIDINVWDVAEWTCNKWEVGMKIPSVGSTTDGWTRTQAEVVVTELFQVKARLKRKEGSKEEKISTFKRDLLADIANISPVVDKIKLNNKKGVLLELDIFDPHFGKLAWAPETGESYDLKIAEDRYYAAVHELLKRAEGYNIKKILYPIGNDMLHYDNLQVETTAGTKQDSDVRYQKMYRKCVEVVIKTAEICAKIAPVELVHVAGNHDLQTGFYLTETIAAYFRNNKNIHVDADMKQRKYFRWGKCGIGFTHGNNEKHSDLPQIMMREMQKTWKGEVDFMEWHLGHFHKKKQVSYLAFDENHGISIRVLRSLSAPDAWHYAKGYVMGLKGAEAFIWDADHGNIANISSILI